MHRRNALLSLVLLVWSGFAIAAYFVAHKPFALQIADPIISLIWTLSVTSILLLNAIVFGLVTIKRLRSGTPRDEATLALSCGIGLGELGLLGFVLAYLGLSNFFILLATQFLLLGWSLWKGQLSESFTLIRNSLVEVGALAAVLPRWMKWATILTLVLTFLLTLLPTADAFDALLYHLTVPALWLKDGGLKAYNIPHYWFPGLVEGMYFWGLGFGSELVSQQIHFSYALCTMLLILSWTRRLWDDLTTGWAIMLLISMPSLFLLASWAYTDLALIFFGLAMLYTLSLGKEQDDRRWWRLSAICAGMAMGVKYTSFVMPLTAILLIAAWSYRRKKELFVEIMKFGFISAATGMVWYLRNWLWMGNPIYPFVFGGRFWDSFRADWYAGAGTGLGWNLKTLLSLPLTITLGYQDVNSIDSDIGPLLLLTLPLALWALTWNDRQKVNSQITWITIGLFSVFGAAFWVYGYITTKNLWQTRLLLPVLVPLVIPASVGLASLPRLDGPRLRISFIVSTLIAFSIFINLLDMGLMVISRNPLGVGLGLVTKESYLEKYQPAYAHALQMASRVPMMSKVYALFEPRSYGIAREIQPDPILDNFSHDVYLYQNPKDIVRAWQKQGYTHVLLNKRFADAILDGTGEQSLFERTISLLTQISVSPDQDYELFVIPEVLSE